jgi:hypothetical protein
MHTETMRETDRRSLYTLESGPLGPRRGCYVILRDVVIC